ncbi:hypothetical protein PFLUV_G00070810 [Perca fluviatilis]|uniref:Uncharacterized protein n=1 Tax=Perca fluviatilis TaxID=8168 RepID=A0A6A5FGQ9_PERFL|nr:hypothetical protein PFLUV_G00070810 [Perca fluviatilis]
MRFYLNYGIVSRPQVGGCFVLKENRVTGESSDPEIAEKRPVNFDMLSAGLWRSQRCNTDVHQVQEPSMRTSAGDLTSYI